jgi:DNA-binding MarR family transcriptional regulator
MPSRDVLPISRIGIIYLAWSRRLQKELLPHGITLKQLHVLQELQRRPALHPAQIAAMLYSDRPTATVIIANLLKNGLVTSERDPDNGRRKRIAISPAGRAKVAAVRQCGFRGNRGFAMERCLSAAEAHQLDTLLQKVQNHVEMLG